MNRSLKRRKIIILMVAVVMAMLCFSNALVGLTMSDKNKKTSGATKKTFSLNGTTYTYYEVAKASMSDPYYKYYQDENESFIAWEMHRDGNKYRIYTELGMRFLSYKSNTSTLSATINLMNNITFKSSAFCSIGSHSYPFTGKFYGNNFYLSNVPTVSHLNRVTRYYGLFSCVSGATIQNLYIKDMNIKCTEYQTLNNISLLVSYVGSGGVKLYDNIVQGTIKLQLSSPPMYDISLASLIARVDAGPVDILNCAVKSDISTSSFNAGNFAGEVHSASMIGNIGNASSLKIQNSYFYGSLVNNFDYDDALELFLNGFIGANVTISGTPLKTCLLKNNVIHLTQYRIPDYYWTVDNVYKNIFTNMSLSSGSGNNRYYLGTNKGSNTFSTTNASSIPADWYK